MLIAIAGPYSAATREENFRILNKAAAQVYLRGHIPVIGVNLAHPVIEHIKDQVDEV